MTDGQVISSLWEFSFSRMTPKLRGSMNFLRDECQVVTAITSFNNETLSLSPRPVFNEWVGNSFPLNRLPQGFSGSIHIYCCPEKRLQSCLLDEEADIATTVERVESDTPFKIFQAHRSPALMEILAIRVL